MALPVAISTAPDDPPEIRSGQDTRASEVAAACAAVATAATSEIDARLTLCMWQCGELKLDFYPSAGGYCFFSWDPKVKCVFNSPERRVLFGLAELFASLDQFTPVLTTPIYKVLGIASCLPPFGLQSKNMPKEQTPITTTRSSPVLPGWGVCPHCNIWSCKTHAQRDVTCNAAFSS